MRPCEPSLRDAAPGTRGASDPRHGPLGAPDADARVAAAVALGLRYGTHAHTVQQMMMEGAVSKLNSKLSAKI